MKVVVISDTHGRHDQIGMIPEGDVLIHCGDGLKYGDLEELVELNEWFGEQTHPHKIYVAGNHDRIFQTKPGEARKVLTNAIYLQNEGISIEGKHFYGSPNTPIFLNWFFMQTEKQLAETFSKIPHNLDVLITHGPPYGVLDWNCEGVRCGSESLYFAAVNAQPKYHCFGHIHEAYGETERHGIKFVNASILNEHYKVSHPPVTFEL